LLAIINKDDRHITLTTSITPRSTVVLLTGPALDSKGPITFKPTTIAKSHALAIPAHTALLYTF
jgi:hypothetical protein